MLLLRNHAAIITLLVILLASTILAPRAVAFAGLDIEPETQLDIVLGGEEHDVFWSIAECEGGGYILAGSSITSRWAGTSPDGWVVRLDADGGVLWEQFYGGTSSDVFYSVASSPDSGYILAGSTASAGSGMGDGWAVKVDSAGETEWSQVIGGTQEDVFRSVVVCPDGGYVFAGFTMSEGAGGSDGWVVKLDDGGQIMWVRVYGYAEQDMFYSAVTADNGETVFSGLTTPPGANASDGWLLKLDLTGQPVWNRKYGEQSEEVFLSLSASHDGGYVLVGKTGSRVNGTQDGLIVNFNDDGAVQWDMVHGGTGQDELNSVSTTQDGGYILSGWTNSEGTGSYDGWVVKLGRSGEIQWEHTSGGKQEDIFWSVAAPSGGAFVIAGYTTSEGSGGTDGWIIKISSMLDVDWTVVHGGVTWDEFNSVKPTPDGGQVLAGWTTPGGGGNSDGWVVKLDSGGNVEWERVVGGEAEEVLLSVAACPDGGYIGAGWTASGQQDSYDGWVVRLDSAGDVQWTIALGDTSWDVFNSVDVWYDGGYLLAGTTMASGWPTGGTDGWVVKLDSAGTVEWSQTYGDTEGDVFNSIAACPDGGIIVAGVASATHWPVTETFDGWVVKLYGNGVVQWNEKYGSSLEDEFHTVLPTSDLGFILAGKTVDPESDSTDGWAVKLYGNGVLQWNRNYGSSVEDAFYSVVESSDDGFIFAGLTAETHGDGTDGWILKTGGNGLYLWSHKFGGGLEDELLSVSRFNGSEYIAAGWTMSGGAGNGDGLAFRFTAAQVAQDGVTPGVTTDITTPLTTTDTPSIDALFIVPPVAVVLAVMIFGRRL